MNVVLERKVANILIPGVDISADEKAFDQLLEIHCLKKQLFSELVKGEANFEEIFEALEAFIGTSNIDAYLLDVCPKLDRLCNHLSSEFRIQNSEFCI